MLDGTSVTRVDQVADALRERVMDGTCAPGHRLVEAALVEEGTDLAQRLGHPLGLLLAEQCDGLERCGHGAISPQFADRSATGGLGRPARPGPPPRPARRCRALRSGL